MKGLLPAFMVIILVTTLLPNGTPEEGDSQFRSVRRTVLLELFTSVNSTDGRDDEAAIEMLAANYSRDQLAILEWYQDGDPLASPDSQGRYLYYGVPAVPTARIDGARAQINSNDTNDTYQHYAGMIDDKLENDTSPAVICANLSLNGTGAAILRYNVSFSDSTANSALSVYCVVYEDKINHTGRNNVSMHRFVARETISEQSLTDHVYPPGGSVEDSVEFRLDAGWNVEELGVIIVLQSDASRSVLQSKAVPLPAAPRHGVVLEPKNQSLNISAGKSAQIKLWAGNLGNVPDTVDFSMLGMAAPWASLGEYSISLAPGQEASLNLSIYIPASAVPGEYLLGIRAASRQEPSKYDEASVTLMVVTGPVFGVSLSPSRAEQQIPAGDSATYRIQVRNTGSVEDVFDLGILGECRQWGILSQVRVSLPPSGEIQLTLAVSVPPDTAGGLYNVTVRGTSGGNPSKMSDSVAGINVTDRDRAYSIALSPGRVSRVLFAGDSSAVNLTVSNLGTARDTIAVFASGDAARWANLSFGSVELEPMGRASLILSIGVPSETFAGFYSLAIKAVSSGNPAQKCETAVMLEVNWPDDPPRIISVDCSPVAPTTKDIVVISAVVSGHRIGKVELRYHEDARERSSLPMRKAGPGYLVEIGPFGKGGAKVTYQVIARTRDGKSNTSIELNFTIKSVPMPAAGGQERNIALDLLVLGMGISVIIAALGSTETGRYRGMWLLFPLYTRLKKAEVLDNFTRGLLQGYIIANPGAHMNALRNRFRLTNGETAYHLRVLEREEYISSVGDGQLRRFYPGRRAERDDAGQELMVTQNLLLHLMQRSPGISKRELARVAGTSPQVVHYHIKKLWELDLISVDKEEGRLRCFVKEPQLRRFRDGGCSSRRTRPAKGDPARN